MRRRRLVRLPGRGHGATIYGDDPTRQGKPAGATCAYYALKPLTESKNRPLFRFCFAGGELTEKKQIRIDGA